MKFTLATIAILAAAVSAQSVADLQAQIPACAQTCLATAISAAGCTLSDTACSCGSNNAAITRSATPCVISGCSSDDALKTQSITGQICKLPLQAGSSAPASSAAAAASSASSAVASVSSKASSAVMSASSKASSIVASATSKASSAVAGGASPTSSGAVQATGAAGKVEVGSLMAGAAFIAALAL